MTDGTVSLRDLAGAIAKTTGRDEQALYDQLRGWVQRGLLKPTGGGGRGAALVFPVDDVYRARILLALKDIGFAEPAIKSIDNSMRAEITRVNANFSFSAAVTSVRKGNSDWVLRVVMQNADVAYGYCEPLKRALHLIEQAIAPTQKPRDPAAKEGIVFIVPAARLIARLMDILEGAR